MQVSELLHAICETPSLISMLLPLLVQAQMSELPFLCTG